MSIQSPDPTVSTVSIVHFCEGRMSFVPTHRYIRTLEDVRRTDVSIVGGKNASLGEMIGTLAECGVRVPTGFATTVEAYRDFMKCDGLDTRITSVLKELE